MLLRDDVERILAEHPWLPRPKYIYILNAPVVFPELRALVHGLNPGFERDTVILGATATPETLIHECIHVARLGEIAAYNLAPRILKLRERFPALIQRPVKYRERRIGSDELLKYGLLPYMRVDHVYMPTKLEVIQLEKVT